MACHDAVRTLSHAGAQLQVLGRYTESEEAAGRATIDPELNQLMDRAHAVQRLSGKGFAQCPISGELFGSAAAKAAAEAQYNAALTRDSEAWGAFQVSRSVAQSWP